MLSSVLRSLSLIALAVALILPYAVTNHTYPIPTFYSEFTAFGLYALLSVIVTLMLRGERAVRSFSAPRAWSAPLAFGVVLIAQTVLLPLSQPSMNWLALGYLLASLSSMQSGYLLGRIHSVETVTRVMAGALIVGGVFAVGCQVAQLLHLEHTFSPFVVSYSVRVNRRPYGNLAQANHLASYIAFALASTLYLAQSRRLLAWGWLLRSIVLSAGLAFTVSRGPWLQVAVMVVAGLWAALSPAQRGQEGLGKTWLYPLALAAVFVIVNIVVRWANVHYHLGLAESASERMRDAGQIAPRLALWKYGLTMFREHPWLGVGWGEFPLYQLKLVCTLGGVEIANNSHDIFIDLLVKSGVLGLGMLLVPLLLWLARALRVPTTVERIYGFGLIGVLLIHALVEYPQQYTFFTLPAMFVIGLLEIQPLRMLPGHIAHGVFAIVSVVALLALYPVLRDYQHAEVLYYGSNPVEQYRAAPSFLFGAWGEYGAATLMPISRDNLHAKLAAHQHALALIPGETVLRRYAVLEALDGRESDALDTVTRLKIFAEVLHDWPTQLTALYKLVDAQPLLTSFQQSLVSRYGKPVGVASKNEQYSDASDE